MIQCEVEIINKFGLHARAAAKLVTAASNFDSDVNFVKDNRSVNGKSIMDVMMLAAVKGTKLTLVVVGTDESDAVKEIKGLFETRFGEQE